MIPGERGAFVVYHPGQQQWYPRFANVKGGSGLLANTPRRGRVDAGSNCVGNQSGARDQRRICFSKLIFFWSQVK
jgi:hypothetical protein